MRLVEDRIRMDSSIVLVSSPAELPVPARNIVLVRSPHQVETGASLRLASDSSILFVGRMSYAPNVEGILWFIDNVLGRIAAAIPEVRLTVVGESPPKALLDRVPHADGRLTVVGAVPDVTPYYAAARLCVVPITLATGVQMKIIQALAAGVPCVATSRTIAQAGLDADRHILEASTVEEWVGACSNVLTDSQLAEGLKEEGQRWAAKQYSADVIRESIRDAYDKAVDRAPIAVAPGHASPADEPTVTPYRFVSDRRRVLSVLDRTEMCSLLNRIIANRFAVSRLVSGRIRVGLLRMTGIKIARGATVDAGVRFDNFNVKVGSGAHVTPGCHFLGSARITIRADSIVYPDSLRLSSVDLLSGVCTTPLALNLPLVVGDSAIGERGQRLALTSPLPTREQSATTGNVTSGTAVPAENYVP